MILKSLKQYWEDRSIKGYLIFKMSLRINANFLGLFCYGTKIVKQFNFIGLGFFLIMLIAANTIPIVFSQSIPREKESTFIPEQKEDPFKKGLNIKVSLDLRDLEIVEALKFIASKSAINMCVSDKVKGRTTFFIKDLPVGDLIELILFTNRLACIKNKGIITVMTEAEYELLYGQKYGDTRQLKTLALNFVDAKKVSTILEEIRSSIGKIIIDEATATLILIDTPEKIREMEKVAKDLDFSTVNRVIPTEREIFELKYAKVKDIEPEISKMLTKDLGIINLDERTNKIIVTDLSHNIEKIRELIVAFDSQTRQVFIEAKIVEVTMDDDYYSGVDWATMFKDMNDMLLEGTYPFGSTAASSLAMSVGTLAADKYEVAFNMIKSVGTARVISSPTIAVCNNQEAKLMVGSRQVYVTSDISTTEASSITSENVKFIDVGVTLFITPSINKDGFVKMRIKPEVSTVSSWITTSSGNRIPVVDTSNVETEVMIKDGRTIVIAGLVKETARESKNKVPVLGDIPGLGEAFRNVSNDNKKKEVLIFFTPHIMVEEKNIQNEKERIENIEKKQ